MLNGVGVKQRCGWVYHNMRVKEVGVRTKKGVDNVEGVTLLIESG